MNDGSPELQETPDSNGAYPRLSKSDMDRLFPHGELRRMSAGDVLFSAGDVVSDFIVIRSGLVAILDNDEGQDQVIRVHGTGRFLGDLGLLEGQPALYSARSPRNVPLWAGLACSPCINAFNNRQSPCRNNLCMQSIGVEQVLARVILALKEKGQGTDRSLLAGARTLE